MGKSVGNIDPTPDLELPKPVERAYMLSKNAGQRGPVLGGYLSTGFDGVEIACTVTPTNVTVVSSETGVVLSSFSPDEGDAFTATCLMPLSSESITNRLCGLTVGTQNGLLLLLELGSNVREIARCESPSKSSISCLALALSSTIIAGTVSGQVLVYDPIRHPETPSVSLSVFPDSESAVTSIAAVSDEGIWVAVDGQGITELSLEIDPALGVVSLKRKDPFVLMSFEGMQSVTEIVVSHKHRLGVCLSSCSEVFLISLDTYRLEQQYPAALMTCGSALSIMIAVEPNESSESTFLFLGGIDGSLTIRELNKRERDGKLQCLLHRCIDRLSPVSKEDLVEPVNPSDGCPISSLWITESLEQCVVGDASCALYLVPISFQPGGLGSKRLSRSSTPSRTASADGISGETENPQENMVTEEA
jgi:hypothetical protein